MATNEERLRRSAELYVQEYEEDRDLQALTAAALSDWPSEEEGLVIGRADYEQMVAHVQAEYPFEACGLLAGMNGRVYQRYPVENRLRSETAYEMEPGQQVKAMVAMEEMGWEMTAIYHSHPQGPETPSATDVAQLYYQEAIQVIVSLRERERPVARAFRIEGENVKEVPLLVV
jgi:[CysO sulfur-carrier protein]-S-L-cysteine hydrolase